MWKRLLGGLTVTIALCVATAGAASASALPEEPSEQLQALAASLQLSGKSVTATARVPGDVAVDNPVKVSISGPGVSSSVPYLAGKGATAKIDLPADHGRIRTENLTVRLSETTETGVAAIDVPWAFAVHPLFDVGFSDLTLKSPCASTHGHHPQALDMVVGLVDPDGANKQQDFRLTGSPFPVHLPGFRKDYPAIDVDRALAKPSIEWFKFEFVGGPPPTFAFPHVAQPIDEATTVVAQTLPDLRGGPCTVDATYTFTSKVVRG